MSTPLLCWWPLVAKNRLWACRCCQERNTNGKRAEDKQPHTEEHDPIEVPIGCHDSRSDRTREPPQSNRDEHEDIHSVDDPSLRPLCNPCRRWLSTVEVPPRSRGRRTNCPRSAEFRAQPRPAARWPTPPAARARPTLSRFAGVVRRVHVPQCAWCRTPCAPLPYLGVH